MDALDELRWIDSELVRLDRARDWLVHRRAVLLAELTTAPPQPLPSHPARARPASPRAELTGRAVARLLLVAGAALVVIAAAAFTVANWSSIGPLGRAVVLLGVSAVTLAAPVPLARRGLRATAESIAAIGLALTIGDAYLVGRLLHAGSADQLLGIATATAALTVAWLGYGRATGLRVPLFAAIGMAQLPGLCVTAQLAVPLAFGLVVTAGADAAVAALSRRREHGAQAKAVSLMAAMTWLAGVTLALIGAVAAPTLPAGIWLAGTMAVASVTGIALWPMAAGPAASVAPVATASGFLLTGIALPVALVLPPGWPVVAFASASFSIVLLALALRRASAINEAGVRLEFVAAGAGAALAVAGLVVVPGALIATGPEAGRPALIVLAMLGLACWQSRVTVARCAAIVAAALAVSSLPAALHAAGAARLAILTAASAALALWAARRHQDAGRALPATAVIAATALGMSAALWSGALWSGAPWSGAPMTVPEVAALAAVFVLAAALAVNDVTAAVATAAALVAVVGLVFAAGWPASQAAFAVIAIAVIATAAATWLRRLRPVQALVLDLGAGPAIVVAATVAARQADTFSLVTVVGAVLASTTSWLRSGARRTVATVAAGCAAGAAIAVQWRPLTLAWSDASLPWRGHPLIGAGATAGLPFAVGVLAIGLAAVVTAFGAMRGSGRGSLDALAIALPVVAGPALLAGGLSYVPALACLLVLALALTCWAAFDGVAPAGGAVVATGLALAWALAAPGPTLIVLGLMAVTYLAFAFGRAHAVMAWLGVFAVGALALTAVIAAGLPVWASGLAVLGVATVALFAARSHEVGLHVAGAGWVTALVGLVLFESAWCVWLAGRGVSAIEPYTLPMAVVVIALGWQVSRSRMNSWISFGPGLALLLWPSLAATWQGEGWIRPTALGVGAATVTLLGARAKLQAPLLIGAMVALLDAGYQLAPAVRRLTELLPGWVPIAAIGALLLWTGATYEARLRNLTSLRRALADLR